MSHYINLLEENERHFHSAAQSSQLLKAGVVLGVGLLLFGIYLAVSDYQNTMQSYETLSQRWKTMEGQVEVAKSRRDQLARVEREANTLSGWSSSRHDWHAVLTYLQERMPPPADQFQYKRLYFDEIMQGLRNTVPETGPYVHPLRRDVRMQLSFVIHGERVEPVVADYEQRLRETDAGESPFRVVRLENITNEIGPPANAARKQFNFTLDLKTRPVKP